MYNLCVLVYIKGTAIEFSWHAASADMYFFAYYNDMKLEKPTSKQVLHPCNELSKLPKFFIAKTTILQFQWKITLSYKSYFKFWMFLVSLQNCRKVLYFLTKF